MPLISVNGAYLARLITPSHTLTHTHHSHTHLPFRAAAVRSHHEAVPGSLCHRHDRVCGVEVRVSHLFVVDKGEVWLVRGSAWLRSPPPRVKDGSGDFRFSNGFVMRYATHNLQFFSSRISPPPHSSGLLYTCGVEAGHNNLTIASIDPASGALTRLGYLDPMHTQVCVGVLCCCYFVGRVSELRA